MTLKTALELLDAAPTGNQPSALNPCLTQTQAVEIVRKAAASLGYPKDKPCRPDQEVDRIIEKRVWQVCKNQKRPRIASAVIPYAY